jgi:hypothetical protein
MQRSAGRRHAAVVVLVAGSLVSSRTAEACHLGTQIGILMFGIAEFGINTPLTIHDLVVSESSRGYGLAETLMTAPGVLIGGALARHTFTRCEEGGSFYPVATRGEQMFTFGMLGWSTALLAHGIYALARPRPARSTAPVLVPVPITSEGGEILGFGVSWRF